MLIITYLSWATRGCYCIWKHKSNNPWPSERVGVWLMLCKPQRTWLDPGLTCVFYVADDFFFRCRILYWPKRYKLSKRTLVALCKLNIFSKKKQRVASRAFRACYLCNKSCPPCTWRVQSLRVSHSLRKTLTHSWQRCPCRKRTHRRTHMNKRIHDGHTY